MKMKRWEVAERAPQSFRDEHADMHPVIADLLFQRGIRTDEEIARFLSPRYEADVHDPFLFSQMTLAVERVFAAIAGQERIVIHGDYDADGLSGAVILATTLKKLGHEQYDVFLPHREKDGYGLNTNTVNLLHQQDTRLLITADCGISNIEEIKEAKGLGMDVIVTDHHEQKAELPPCIILHPKVKGESYPFRDLAGGGVAFKLAQALLRTEAKQKPERAQELEAFEKWLLDMVAIASVADMVPLVGENRTLVKYGLMILQKAKRPGIRAMLTHAGVFQNGKLPELTTVDIGFVIGPRMNAAGRMAHANAAYAALMAQDDIEAMKLAEGLEQTNRERRDLSDKIFKQAMEQIGEVPDEPSVLMAQDDSWPMGVVGLIAGKVMEKTYRPVFIMGQFDGLIAGSGRSIEGFDCTEVLKECADLLKKFGGHPRACGFTIADNAYYEKLKERFNDYAKRVLTPQDLIPILHIDAQVHFNDLTWDFYDQLQSLRPFGMGNPEPLLLVRNVKVVDCSGVGKENNHLRCVITDEDGKIMRKVIAFKQPYWVETLRPGERVDLVFRLDVNEWNGNRELQLKVEEIKLAEGNIVELKEQVVEKAEKLTM